MKVTIKDVANLAGVSDTAVSLAFKKKSRISSKTRELILKVAGELNYTPNLAAKNLRSGSSNTIGFIVNDITNPFYALMLKEAERSLEKAGFDMFVASSGWNAAKELKLIDKMLQMRVQGIIICFCEKGYESLKALDRYNLPHIAVDSYPHCYKGSYVANDFKACGRMMAHHFLEIGAQKPGILNADESMKNFSAFRKIFNSFKETLEKNGLKILKKNIMSAGLNIEAGRKAFEKSVENNFDADAIFCANDLCALGFIDAAEAAGIRTGKDIAVAGIDDIEISSFSKLSLTSIRQPYSLIVQEAVTNLLEHISSSKKTVKKELKPELIIRKTTSEFVKQ